MLHRSFVLATVVLATQSITTASSQENALRRWLAENGGCKGSAATLEKLPVAGKDQSYLGIAGADWNQFVRSDYAKVRAECRSEARTGSSTEKPTPDDYTFGFEQMAELSSTWSRKFQEPAEEPVAKERAEALVAKDRSSRNVGSIDFIRDVSKHVGDTVMVGWIPGCAGYGGKYYCRPMADHLANRILIVADSIDGDEWREKIERRCTNLATAVSCRPRQITFVVEGYGTDLSGTVRIVRTSVMKMR